MIEIFEEDTNRRAIVNHMWVQLCDSVMTSWIKLISGLFAILVQLNFILSNKSIIVNLIRVIYLLKNI